MIGESQSDLRDDRAGHHLRDVVLLGDVHVQRGNIGGSPDATLRRQQLGGFARAHATDEQVARRRRERELGGDPRAHRMRSVDVELLHRVGRVARWVELRAGGAKPFEPILRRDRGGG